MGWHRGLSADFSRRLINLFAFAFRDFDPALALSIVENGRRELAAEAAAHALSPEELSCLLSPHDLKRLEAYSRNLVRGSVWEETTAWACVFKCRMWWMWCCVWCAGGWDCCLVLVS